MLVDALGSQGHLLWPLPQVSDGLQELFQLCSLLRESVISRSIYKLCKLLFWPQFQVKQNRSDCVTLVHAGRSEHMRTVPFTHHPLALPGCREMEEAGPWCSVPDLPVHKYRPVTLF